MTGPRTKRQFAGAASDPAQRQITSFFPKTASSTNLSATSAPSRQSNHNVPALPAQIQTDLLNVGMRVRKAVPEGYKTGSSYCAFQLWAEQDNTSPAPTTTTTTTAPSAKYASTIRELEPFCGIHKVGGLGFQTLHAVRDENHDDDDSEEADELMSMPGLTSSQESAISTTSSIAPAATTTLPLHIMAPALNNNNNRKRFFASDEDDERAGMLLHPHQHVGPFRLNNHDDAWLDGEISPCSLAPAGWENARVLAVPKTRQSKPGRKSGGAVAAAAAELVGQENVMVVTGGADGNDFEEASFLDYRLAVDMDVE